MMKMFVATIGVCSSLSFPQCGFSMNDEPVEYLSSSVHSIHYTDGNFALRSPQTTDEWKSYHSIRIAQIHEKYCQGTKYEYKSNEEELENNFRFVFVDTSTTPSKVIGVIRVDLLVDKGEAALRWVAIEGELQRRGFGTRMLALSERFAKDRKKTLMRVPAEKESQAFYERLGYISMDWPNGPHHPEEVSLGKKLND